MVALHGTSHEPWSSPLAVGGVPGRCPSLQAKKLAKAATRRPCTCRTTHHEPWWDVVQPTTSLGGVSREVLSQNMIYETIVFELGSFVWIVVRSVNLYMDCEAFSRNVLSLKIFPKCQRTPTMNPCMVCGPLHGPWCLATRPMSTF